MFSEKIRAEILDGRLADHKTHLAGYCRGYYMTFALLEGGYRLTVNASTDRDPGNAALNTFLEQCRGEHKKIISVGVSPYRFYVVIRAAALQKKIPELVNGVMDPILRYLAAGGYASGCGSCGTASETLGCWQVNDEILQLCDPCAVRMEQELKGNQKAVKARKSNFLGGLVGSLLGALLGSVLWILIYRLGYIAGIAGLVIVVCAMKGYSILGGNLDRKGVISSLLISLILVFLSNKIAWSWEVYSELKDYGLTFFDIFRSLTSILKEVEIMGDYIKDLVIGYMLTTVASFFYIRNALHTSTGGYTFKKVD